MMPYLDLLPAYLRGQNIERHAGIIDSQNRKLLKKINILRGWNTLNPPVLIEVSHKGWTNPEDKEWLGDTVTVYFHTFEFISKITVTGDYTYSESFTEEDALKEHSITFDVHEHNPSLLVTVETDDGVTYSKGYPENDTPQGDDYDHDEFLDVMGKILNVPRRTYSEYLYDYAPFVTPPYMWKELDDTGQNVMALSCTEDDYYYRTRLMNFIAQFGILGIAQLIAMVKYNMNIQKVDLKDPEALEAVAELIPDFDLEDPTTYKGTIVYMYSQVNQMIDGQKYYYENIAHITDNSEDVALLEEELSRLVPCTRKVYTVPGEYVHPTFPVNDIEDSITITWLGTDNPSEIPDYTVMFYSRNVMNPSVAPELDESVVVTTKALTYTVDYDRIERYAYYVRILTEPNVFGNVLDTGLVEITLKKYTGTIVFDNTTLLAGNSSTVGVSVVDEKGEDWTGVLQVWVDTPAPYADNNVVITDGTGSFTIPGNSSLLSSIGSFTLSVRNYSGTSLFDITDTKSMTVVSGYTFDAEGTLSVFEAATIPFAGVLKFDGTEISGQRINLYDSEDVLRNTAITGSDGSFSFNSEIAYFDDATPLSYRYEFECQYETVVKNITVTRKQHDTFLTVPDVSATVGDTAIIQIGVADENNNPVPDGTVEVDLEYLGVFPVTIEGLLADTCHMGIKDAVVDTTDGILGVIVQIRDNNYDLINASGAIQNNNLLLQGTNNVTITFPNISYESITYNGGLIYLEATTTNAASLMDTTNDTVTISGTVQVQGQTSESYTITEDYTEVSE